MSKAIEENWKNEEADRHYLMVQTTFVPCDCKKCYFCANRHASVICHPVEKKLEVEFANVLRKEGYDRHTK